MAPTDIVWPTGSELNFNPKEFKGLSLSSRPQNTLLDGNVGSNWWFSVGNSIAHNGGNPVINLKDGSGIATRTSLYIKQGKIMIL